MAVSIMAGSLAGRFEGITLLPFTQSEPAGTLFERQFAVGGWLRVGSPFVGEAPTNRFLKGGYLPDLFTAARSDRLTLATLGGYIAMDLAMRPTPLPSLANAWGQPDTLLNVLEA